MHTQPATIPHAPRPGEIAMKKKYEAHLTFDKVYSSQVQAYSKDTSWRFSQIDGDPVLGLGPRCYLTSYDESYDQLKTRMEHMHRHFVQHGVQVSRRKIEEIVYDSATEELPIMTINLSISEAATHPGKTTISALLYEVLTRCGYEVNLATDNPLLAAPGYFKHIKESKQLDTLLEESRPRCKIELVVI